MQTEHEVVISPDANSAEREVIRLRNDAAGAAVEMLAKLIGATCELFGGPVSMYESFDPEFRNGKYTVFSALPAI